MARVPGFNPRKRAAAAAKTRKITECKVATVNSNATKKRGVQYVNHRTGVKHTIKVGVRGGLSYMPRGPRHHRTRHRRYVSGACKKTSPPAKFWEEVKREEKAEIIKAQKSREARKRAKLKPKPPPPPPVKQKRWIRPW